MQKMKKYLSVLLTLVMVLGLTTTAFAADGTDDRTIISHDEDTGVMSLSSEDADSILYTSVLVKGGSGLAEDGVTPVEYPDVATYSYYIELPSTATSTNAVAIDAFFSELYSLRIDGSEVAAAGEMAYTGTLDFSTGTHTLALYDGTTKVREFVVAAGIAGSVLQPVYVSINVKRAYDYEDLSTSANAALNYLDGQCDFDAEGKCRR